jgi:hypothetical protein
MLPALNGVEVNFMEALWKNGAMRGKNQISLLT